MESSPSPAPARRAAPTVTVVLVIHDPGERLGEVLRSIGEQDYPDLSVLVVDTGRADDQGERVRQLLPDARYRRLDGDVGFSEAADSVLPQETDSVFYAFCHDDVRLEPSTIRLLVEETFRSNAGVVGPKLVEWGDPHRLLQVGMTADKTGAPAGLVEPGELDQEQHDAVRDVFFVPGGLILVRADLFAALGGFDGEMSFLGEDLDFCWRAHVAGARVMVAPMARVEHQELLRERLPADERRRLQSRHQVRSLLTCYSTWHLIRVVPQALLLALIETVGAVLVGHPDQARAVKGAWSWNLRRTAELKQRRRAVKAARQVKDSEVRRLQARGFTRLTAFVRGQVGGGEDRMRGVTGVGRSVAGRLRDPGTQRALGAWVVLLAVLGFGSRHLITQGIPAVGEFVAVGPSSSRLMQEFLSGYRDSGLGSAAAAPTGLGLLAVLGPLVIGKLELLRTLLIVGMLPLGLLGVWRLLKPTGSRAARLVGLLGYTALPVAYNSLGRAHWSGLVAYAAAPWVLSQLARLEGTAPYGPRDGSAGPGVGERTLLQRVLALGVIVALAAFLVPVTLVLVLIMAIGLALGAIVAGQPKGTGRVLAGSVGAAALAVVLHLPWSLEFVSGGWAVLGRPRQSPYTSLDVGALLRFETGDLGAPVLGWAVLVAAVLPLLIGRDWRLAWAIRGWFVAMVCWGVAFVGLHGWLPVELPPIEVLLAPAAVGLALSVAMGMAAFEIDLPDYHFGWRQVLSLVAGLALLLAVLPVLGEAVVDGRWGGSADDLTQRLNFLEVEQEEAAFRVLWLGDPEILPLSGWVFDEDVTYATTSEGLPTTRDVYPGDPGGVNQQVREALAEAASGDTTRLGEMLAPMGVRFILLPLRLDPTSDVDIVPDSPIVGALPDQLDLAELEISGAVRVWENDAWVPMRADVTLVDQASGGAVTSNDDAPPAEPALIETTAFARFEGPLEGGSSVYQAAGGSGWRLDIDGEPVAREPAGGWASSFDVDRGGEATLAYDTPASRSVLVLVGLVVWAVVLVLLLRARAGPDEVDEVDDESRAAGEDAA